MSKRPSFMQRFGRQHVNGSSTLVKSAPNHFHKTLPLICEGRSRKSFALVRFELLLQFVKTLTADYQYSRWNRENLWQQVPMQISRKLNTF